MKKGEKKASSKDTRSTWEKLKLLSQEHCLMWLPKKYVDYTRKYNGEIDVPGLVFDGFVHEKARFEGPGRFSIVMEVDSNWYKAYFFGQLRFHPLANYEVGERLVLIGKAKKLGREITITSPEQVPQEHLDKVIPVYPGIRSKVKASDVSDMISEALKLGEKAFERSAQLVIDAFGEGFTEEKIMAFTGMKGVALVNMFKALHQPKTIRNAENAMIAAKRIAGAYIQVKADQLHQKFPLDESALKIDHQWIRQKIATLPYPLTPSQDQSVKEICADLESHYPMHRLLSGDVGFGKTLTYCLPAIAAHLKGAKVAVLIQNSLLVNQVVQSMRDLYPNIDVRMVRTAKDIGKIDQLQADRPILVGTSGMSLTLAKIGYHVDLLIIDEQQKLSVEQKKLIQHAHTNVLEATATCVPRTTALVEYGGMDVSVLKHCPVKKEIRTGIVTPGSKPFDKKAMFEYIKKMLSNKQRVAMIYPRVEDKEEENNHMAIENAAKQWFNILSHPLAVIHGKKKPEIKEQEMAKFKKNEVSLLISSTVVEIGVDIPDLKVMVIVDAGRYGISTLHQIRGRLVRNGGVGVCILYCPEEPEESTLNRLQVVASTNDGFKLAELDAEIRGYGSLSDEPGDQSGTSKTLFPNIHLMPSDIVLGSA